MSASQRTAAQIAADEGIRKAIEHALGVKGQKGVLADYLLIVETTSIDDDGDVIGNGSLFYPNGGEVPKYRALGMLSHAQEMVEGDYGCACGCEDDEG